MSFTPDQRHVMVLRGSASTGATSRDGQYLSDMDFELNGGQGHVTLTPHLALAKQFASLEEAWEYWRRVPEAKRLRPDGQPNRPLTAMHWEFKAL